MIGLIRQNDDIIGFVYICLFCDAITEQDVREWAINVVSSNDINYIPDYVIGLMDSQELKSPSRGIEKLIGFIPSWKRSREQEYALYGIALKRGMTDFYDAPVTELEAINALKKHPEIESRFRETFPFIDF